MARAHGEGSIVQRKDGLWQASLQVDGIRRTVYAKSKREVAAKLHNLRREVDELGWLTSVGGHTVSDLFDRWLEIAPNLKPSTVAHYRLVANAYIAPELGELRLKQVRPFHLQKLYSDLTPSVADRVHRLLHRAFAVAVLWGWLPANPSDHVLKPVYSPERPTVWSQEELDIFLSSNRDHWLYPVWLLLASTGLRVGEALALNWGNIDTDGMTLTVSGTLKRLNKEWVITSPKTTNSRRTITLPAVALEGLSMQREQQARWQKAAADDWEDRGLIFTGKTGNPLFHSVVYHALKRECGRLSLPVITTHGLRHLHASLLIDSGLPITTVAARLGHANPQITMKLYAHALPGRDKQAAEAIAEILDTHAKSRKREAGEE